jgi:hypothetical protein
VRQRDSGAAPDARAGRAAASSTDGHRGEFLLGGAAGEDPQFVHVPFPFRVPIDASIGASRGHTRNGRIGVVTIVGVRKLSGAAGALTILLVLLGLLGPAVPAWAEDPEPFARSAATTYQVTMVARACASYADVMANQVRDDAAESPGRPGHDSPYKPGQPVDPDVEDRSACEPLPGVSFTLGGGREKKGPLSSVAGAGTAVTTGRRTPRLDALGRPTGGPLRGAVTVTLTRTR